MSETIYKMAKTLQGFHDDSSLVRAVVGPVGSGKSTAMCMEIMLRSLAQKPAPDGVRRTRWVVIRNTYRELLDTTVATWLAWFPESTYGDFNRNYMVHIIERDGLRIEVLFRALDQPDDVKKLLSLEVTAGFINEAREVAEPVLQMLLTRVGRYPSQRDGGPTWYGVVLDSNASDVDHWLYRMFEEKCPPGWRIWHQPSGRSPYAENIENLPRDYYDKLAAGARDDWIRVYVDGLWGFALDGKPVHPQYNDTVHCKAFELVQGWPLYLGIDWGLTPAAVIAQRSPMGAWRIRHEIVAQDMGARRFGELLRTFLQERCDDFSIAEIAGDPAGDARAQSDESTPFEMVRSVGIEARPAPTNDFVKRVEVIDAALTRMLDGEPGFIVHPDCRTLRKGLAGGYCYKRLQVSGHERFKDVPDKTQYSHVVDALQYCLLGAGEARNIVRRAPRGDRQKYAIV